MSAYPSNGTHVRKDIIDIFCVQPDDLARLFIVDDPCTNVRLKPAHGRKSPVDVVIEGRVKDLNDKAGHRDFSLADLYALALRKKGVEHTSIKLQYFM